MTKIYLNFLIGLIWVCFISTLDIPETIVIGGSVLWGFKMLCETLWEKRKE